MPIEVEGPDGVITEFPDGTDDATINRVMRDQYGGPLTDKERVARGGRTLADQQAKVDREAAEYERKVANLNRQESIGRTLGLGGRAILKGLTAIPDLVASPLASLANKVLPESMQQTGFGGAVDFLADKAGAPKPRNAQERVYSDVMSGITGAAVPVGLGQQLARLPKASQAVRGVGKQLAAQPAAQIAGGGLGAGTAGVTRESGGGPGAQLAAGIVGGSIPVLPQSLGAAAARGALRGGEKNRQALASAIDDFSAVGAAPSVGQGTGSWGRQGAESLLAAFPTAGGVMRRSAEKQAEQIGKGLRAKADKLSPNASGEQAGRAIERGVEQFGRNVSAVKKALYWQADRHIPGESKVKLANTWQAIENLTTPTEGASATTGALINPKIANLRATLAEDIAAGGGQIPYEALKRIRTEIGESISDYSLSPDTPTRELKQLYAALSRDMEEAAKAAGPEAVQAAKRANNYTRAAANRLEDVQRVIDKNGGPEAVFNAAMQGTKDGGTTLRKVMQSLPEEGQKAVTAAVIKRMGLATPGAQDAAGEVFSAAHFLTNWNKVSPEAKRALFDRYGPTFRADMDKIARVAQSISDGSEVFKNPSGTANRGAAITYAGSLAGSLLLNQIDALTGLLASGAAANVGSRLLTNPRMVKWLAKATEMPPSAAATQANVLARIAQETGDEDAAELTELLREQASDKEEQGN